MNHLHRAILDGDTEAARRIARDRPSLISELSPSGKTTLELARDNGYVPTVVALLHLLDGERSVDPGEALELLEDYIRELSHTFACAGWLHDIEFNLWYAVTTRRQLPEALDPHGFYRLPEEMLDDLKFLSERAGAWLIWRDKGPAPINLANWSEHYERWGRSRDV